jgi:hypothetical protein
MQLIGVFLLCADFLLSCLKSALELSAIVHGFVTLLRKLPQG